MKQLTVEQLEQKIKEANKKEAEINKKLEERYIKDATKKIRKSINAFYHTYKPIYYHRQWGLRNMFNISANNGRIKMKFDGSFAENNYSQGSDYVFNIVFLQGYHGGSDYGEGHPAPGIPYWKTPHPYYTEWSRSAKQSESPMDLINEALDQYDSKFQSIRQDIIKKEITSWLYG